MQYDFHINWGKAKQTWFSDLRDAAESVIYSRVEAFFSQFLRVKLFFSMFFIKNQKYTSTSFYMNKINGDVMNENSNLF